MRRLGVIAAYAVVATLAIATPLSAQQQPAPAPTTAPAPAAPAPAAPVPGEAAPAEPVPLEPAPAEAPAPAEPVPAAPAPAPAEPAPAEPAPAEPAPAEPAPAEPQALVDDGPVKKKRKVRAVAAASTGVTISDFQFSPGAVTVNVGDTVTWTNDGPTPHSATANDGSFDTGIMDAGQSGSHTFTQAGTFSYICTPHPNMTGTVTVVAAATDDDSTGGTGSAPTDSPADDGPALPSSGMDVGGLAVLGLATLALGAYLRRRTAPAVPRPAGRIGW